MAKKVGFDVLRLPLFYCILNPIEMVWNQLKQHVRHFNFYTCQLSNVVDLIGKLMFESCFERERKVSHVRSFTG